MTHSPRKLLAGLVAVAAGLAAVGCGGDTTPNPSLEVPKSTTTLDDVKAGRGGMAKQPGKKSPP